MPDQTKSILAAALLMSAGTMASSPAAANTPAPPVRPAASPGVTAASSTPSSPNPGGRADTYSRSNGDGRYRSDRTQPRFSQQEGLYGRDRYYGRNHGDERYGWRGHHDGYRGHDAYYPGRYGYDHGHYPRDFRGAWGYRPGFNGYAAPYGYGWGWGGGFAPVYFAPRPAYGGWGWGWGGGFAPAPYGYVPQWGWRGGQYLPHEHYHGYDRAWGRSGMPEGRGYRPTPNRGWARVEDGPQPRAYR